MIQNQASWAATWQRESGPIIRARSGTGGDAALIGIRYDRGDGRGSQAAEAVNADAL